MIILLLLHFAAHNTREGGNQVSNKGIHVENTGIAESGIACHKYRYYMIHL